MYWAYSSNAVFPHGIAVQFSFFIYYKEYPPAPLSLVVAISWMYFIPAVTTFSNRQILFLKLIVGIIIYGVCYTLLLYLAILRCIIVELLILHLCWELSFLFIYSVPLINLNMYFIADGCYIAT